MILKLQDAKVGAAVIVSVAGRLDGAGAPEIAAHCNTLITGGATRLLLDVAGVDYISSAGLRGLLVTARKLKGAGGQVRFANVRGMVKGVFDISGFGSILPVDDSVAAALDRIAAV